MYCYANLDKVIGATRVRTADSAKLTCRRSYDLRLATHRLRCHSWADLHTTRRPPHRTPMHRMDTMVNVNEAARGDGMGFYDDAPTHPAATTHDSMLVCEQHI